MISSKNYDEQTGISYYGYRFYNPIIGRWMTLDPLGEAGGINLYQMVGNNPVNWIDPWGLQMIRRPGSTYFLGRKRTFVEPGGRVGSYMEDHIAHLHQTSKFHDSCVGTLRGIGVPDLLANYPTMIPAFGAALIYNNLTDYSQPPRNRVIIIEWYW